MRNFSSLVELLRCRAAEQPNFPVYTFLEDGEKEEQKITCAELDRKARTIGAYLQKLKLTGERALLLYPPGLEYIAAFFGCLYADVIAVPAYPPDPNRLNRTLPRLQAVIKDSKATVVLTTDLIYGAASLLFEQTSDLTTLQWIATDSLENNEKDWREPFCSRESIAFLQYTSGSTGNPRGVILSHCNLLYTLELISQAFRITSESIGVSWLPPYHDMGLIGPILASLYGGGRAVLMSPIAFLQKPVRWLKAISQYQGTISGGPNFAFDLCTRKITAEEKAELNLSSWDLAFNGAEPIRSGTFHRFANHFESCGFKSNAFYPCYGLAEATLIVSGGKKGEGFKTIQIHSEEFRKNRIQNSQLEKSIDLVSCGANFSGQKMIIVNPVSLSICQPEEIGEIWISGDHVALGYWQKSEETDFTFHAFTSDSNEGPFLRTGDLGFISDKELFVTGRLKDLLIIRGQNHYPQDIESTVEKVHPALRMGCGAAFSVELEGEEKLVVVQELDLSDKNFVSLSYLTELGEAVRQAVIQTHDLETYSLLFLKKGSIPKTSSGKISRYACREAFLSNKLEVIKEWTRKIHKTEKVVPHLRCVEEPSSDDNGKIKSGKEIEKWLSEQLVERLHISMEEIDKDRSLSTYGLDSKEAVNLSGELEDWIGFSIAPTLLWQYPTIRLLSEELSKRAAGLLTEEGYLEDSPSALLENES